MSERWPAAEPGPLTAAVSSALKRDRPVAEVPSYWLVDPLGPSLTVLELDAGSYVERAVVRGDERYRARRPFPVEVVPSELLR